MYSFLLTVQVISIFTLVIESGYVFAKMKTNVHKYLFLNCVATLVNNTGYLLMMLSSSEEQYLTALQMSYLGRVWIPFSLIVFSLAVCKIPIKKWIVMGLAVFHSFIYLLVMTCRWNNLYYRSMEYRMNGPWGHIECGPGIFHNIYTMVLISYILVGLTLLIQLTWQEKIPTARKRLILITMAMAIESGGYLVNLTGVTGGYDCTVMGYTIGTFFMYIAIFRYKLMDTLQLAKDYVVDELSEAIIAVDQNGKLEYYNKPVQEILSKRILDLEGCIQEIKKAVSAEEPMELDGHIYSPQEKILYQNNEPCGKVYVLVDETEHYHYMHQLKEQKEIAEEANASKSAFLSIVSHEIRTPMNAVVGMTDLLLRDKESLSDKQEKYLKNIKNSGSALVMIVNDILDQSKIEAGKMEIIEQPYEFRSMAADVKMIIENRIGSKPIHLMYEIDDDVPQFLIGDSLRIRQILINLMNNAVKYTEEGYIRLKVEVVDEEAGRRYLRFGVKDSGQGIRKEDLAKLGEAFTQVDTKKNHSKEGTGLGLSISRDFISMMGGQLEVTSEYQKGSEFYFSIWQGIAAGIVNTNASGVTKQAWQSEEKFTAKGARILIVDDTKINLMVMEGLLEPLNMTIDTATSGEKAIELVQKNFYHVIFMDYMMPYMDGVETTKRIRNLVLDDDGENQMREADYFKSVPVIALSGDTSDTTKENFMRAGIDDFIEKPVEIGRIKKLLLKWLPSELISG